MTVKYISKQIFIFQNAACFAQKSRTRTSIVCTSIVRCWQQSIEALTQRSIR